MKSEYLMLGQVYKPGKVSPASWFVSEKLDGVRAYYDGGISRGVLAKNVPYSNTIKDTNPQVATGLWSRTGKVIHAPDWWLDKLPSIPLDGELYLGPGKFQETYSIISKYTGGDWREIDYRIFDSPPYEIMLRARIIKVRDYQFSVKWNAYDWYLSRKVEGPNPRWTFEMVQEWLKNRVKIVEQIRLPFNHFAAVKEMDSFLREIMDKGGEGVILRRAVSFWIAERSHFLLKFKPFLDSEGVVVGYKMGEGKYRGMMGSLILKSKEGKIFKISGFTDSERVLSKIPEISEIYKDCGSLFKIGSRVTYKYRELSDDDIPKEPRYWRKA